GEQKRRFATCRTVSLSSSGPPFPFARSARRQKAGGGRRETRYPRLTRDLVRQRTGKFEPGDTIAPSLRRKPIPQTAWRRSSDGITPIITHSDKYSFELKKKSYICKQ